MSSAYELILELVGKSRKSLRKMLNNKGPITDPYARPYEEIANWSRHHQSLRSEINLLSSLLEILYCSVIGHIL